MFSREIRSLKNELIEIYKDLHRHPELGFNEVRTASVIAEYLRKCNLEVYEQIALTGVVGILDSGKAGKTLMIRADMDCLMIEEQTDCDYRSEYPKRMHACGHDTHIVMLLGAAKILSGHKDAFFGKIKFVFEPAEEGIDPKKMQQAIELGYQTGGARALVREGVLDDVDMCFVIHNEPSLPVGFVQIPVKNAYAASDVFEIKLIGKGGHGARPHSAINPIPAMGDLISALYSIPVREISCLLPNVISVGNIETPGSVWNSIPEQAVISGGFRSFHKEVSEHYYKRIPEIAAEIAKAYRCTAKTMLRHGLDPTINNSAMARSIEECCRNLSVLKEVRLADAPTMASESAGVYLSRVSGVILHLGSGDLEHELHNPHMLPDTDMLEIGVMVHTAVAVSLLKE